MEKVTFNKKYFIAKKHFSEKKHYFFKQFAYDICCRNKKFSTRIIVKNLACRCHNNEIKDKSPARPCLNI